MCSDPIEPQDGPPLCSLGAQAQMWQGRRVLGSPEGFLLETCYHCLQVVQGQHCPSWLWGPASPQAFSLGWPTCDVGVVIPGTREGGAKEVDGEHMAHCTPIPSWVEGSS